jgi:hypothetical protein
MRLPASEVARFYTLYPALLLYANQQLGLARQVTTIPQLMAMPEEEQYALRAAFYGHREIIEAFVHANPEPWWRAGSTVCKGSFMSFGI